MPMTFFSILAAVGLLTTGANFSMPGGGRHDVPRITPVAAAATTPVVVRHWSVGLSGMLQLNSSERVNWYTTNPTAMDSESAANGTHGVSGGVDVAFGYQVARRVNVGVAVSITPMRLHAEVHRTAQQRFAKPTAHVTFVPLRLTADIDLLHGSTWTLRVGPQVGVGLFGTADVVPEFGRSRRFGGGGQALVGAHIGVRYASPSSRWGVSATFQIQRTGFSVSELGTGDLPQDLTVTPEALLVGIEWRFGRR